MGDVAEVSVIMPTCALAARAPLIQRALNSVLSQQSVRAVPIVVINGHRRDPDLVRTLTKDSRLRTVHLENGSLPDALLAGRAAVDTEWFSGLDDDDQYLPGTLAARVGALRAQGACDTVISNGYIRGAGPDQLHPRDLGVVERAPLAALAKGNWLLPGAWLCRSDRVGTWLFEGMPQWAECTYLALRFSLHCTPCFLDSPGVVWHKDTPESESKSRAYVEGQPAAIERILELPLPEDTRRWAERRKSAAEHSMADIHLGERAISQAWKWHLRSLTGSGGLRYLLFTLRLLLPVASNRAHVCNPSAHTGD